MDKQITMYTMVEYYNLAKRSKDPKTLLRIQAICRVISDVATQRHAEIVQERMAGLIAQQKEVRPKRILSKVKVKSSRK